MHPSIVAISLVFTVIGLVGFAIYASHQYEKRRTEKMQALAAEIGLQFYPSGDPSLLNAIGELRLFDRGRRRKSTNMFRGQTEDVDLAIFGYQFTTGHGKNQRTHRQTVVSFQSPQLTLPEFELRPEHLFHRIGQAFGYQDIDFESHPVFSKRYLLRGPNEAAIRSLFNSHVLEFFEATQGVSLEAKDNRLIYYRSGKRIKPEEVRSFMEEGFCVFRLFK